MAEGDGDKIVKNAINQGLRYLHKLHGLDMDIEAFSNYMNASQVVTKAGEIASSEECQNSSNQPEFLKEKIIEYIVNYEPFNEKGKKLLKGSLEVIAGQQSLWGKVFSGKKGKKEYLESYSEQRDDALDLVGQVVSNQKMYSDTPEGCELVKSAKQIHSDLGKGALREARYAQGKFEEDKLLAKKSESYKNMTDFLGKYDSYISVVIGVFAIGLISVSGLRLTGGVIGGGIDFGAGLVGGLLLILGMSLFLLKKKN